MNQRAFVFAGNNAFERALFGDAEDDDVEFAFAAEGDYPEIGRASCRERV